MKTPHPETPAFAATAVSHSDDVYHQPGLTIRQYYAAKAMQAVIGELDFKKLVDNCDEIFKSGAALSFAIADAMIEHEAKPDVQPDSQQ